MWFNSTSFSSVGAGALALASMGSSSVFCLQAAHLTPGTAGQPGTPAVVSGVFRLQAV